MFPFHFQFGLFSPKYSSFRSLSSSTNNNDDQIDSCSRSKKVEEQAKKLRAKTPIGKLEEIEEGQHPYREKEPLKPWPGGVNPNTGEIGGPKGPEPTRFGDWERKGRVSDF